MNKAKERLLAAAAAILILISAPLYAQVNTQELEDSQAPVSFINYEGPHARIESRAQIRGIGYTLGAAARESLAAGREGSQGAQGSFFIIHSVSEADGDKLDADIMGLGVDVGVDHIRNLRLIIQGYLEGAYSYSEQDAALLSEYITVYNAVFRGDWDFFTGRYKEPVLQHLTPDKAGLSIRFDEWPGQTLMVIPLALARPGALSAVDTSTLTDPRVTEELRQSDDRGIPQRQGMVDLLERESEEAEKSAREQRQEIAREEQQITGDKQQVQEEREEIARERQQLREEEEAGTVSEEEARKTEEELAVREEAAERKEEEIAQREDALEEKREEAERTEEFAEQKAEEAQEQRQEITEDQQEIIVRETVAPPPPEGILGAKLERPESPLGRLVLLSADAGAELMVSALNTVNIRTLHVVDGRILAIAGENRGNGAIRLIEVDPASLEMRSQGDDDIHPQSLLWVSGSDLYAITVSEGSLYLGRYNTQLARQARSTVPVHPFATLLFRDDVIVTQSADGQGLILNSRDLSRRE
jgi:hypothetical protein